MASASASASEKKTSKYTKGRRKNATLEELVDGVDAAQEGGYEFLVDENQRRVDETGAKHRQQDGAVKFVNMGLRLRDGSVVSVTNVKNFVTPSNPKFYHNETTPFESQLAKLKDFGIKMRKLSLTDFDSSEYSEDKHAKYLEVNHNVYKVMKAIAISWRIVGEEIRNNPAYGDHTSGKFEVAPFGQSERKANAEDAKDPTIEINSKKRVSLGEEGWLFPIRFPLYNRLEDQNAVKKNHPLAKTMHGRFGKLIADQKTGKVRWSYILQDARRVRQQLKAGKKQYTEEQVYPRLDNGTEEGVHVTKENFPQYMKYLSLLDFNIRFECTMSPMGGTALRCMVMFALVKPHIRAMTEKVTTDMVDDMFSDDDEDDMKGPSIQSDTKTKTTSGGGGGADDDEDDPPTEGTTSTPSADATPQTHVNPDNAFDGHVVSDSEDETTPKKPVEKPKKDKKKNAVDEDDLPKKPKKTNKTKKPASSDED
jgi:hypothetical protein